MDGIYEFDPGVPAKTFCRHRDAVAFLLDCGYIRGGRAVDVYENAEGSWAFIRGTDEDGWAVSYPPE